MNDEMSIGDFKPDINIPKQKVLYLFSILFISLFSRISFASE